MSKRFDLIKPLWDSIVSSYESQKGNRFNLPYADMDLSALAFNRSSDEEVQGHMRNIREYLGTNPCFGDHDAYLAWKASVKDYNRLARFYRNQGIDIEPIVYEGLQTSKGREHLKERIFIKRFFRDLVRTEGLRQDLSEVEMERELLKRGLSVSCSV